MRKIIFVAAALAFSAGASAQAYKWKDANGHTRYGDTPPPGVAATQIRGPSRIPAPEPAAEAKDEKADKAGKAEKPLTPEQAFRKRQQDRAAAEDKAAKERADAEAKKSNCQTAQTQLRLLESGQRVSTLNAAGERVYLDDGQRAAETARAQKAVSDWCN
jgi:hypothetical protein